MEERYTYTVVPRKPIRGLVKNKLITRSANLSLSKDEVEMCLKHGAVYRKFYLDKEVRVTSSNLDRLHRPTRISDAEWDRILKKQVQDYVEENIPDESVIEAMESEVEESIEDSEAESVEEVVSDEQNDEVPVEEDTVDEAPEEEEVIDTKKVEEEQSTTGDNESDSLTEPEVVEEETPIATEEAPVVEDLLGNVNSKSSRSKSSSRKRKRNSKKEESSDVPETAE